MCRLVWGILLEFFASHEKMLVLNQWLQRFIEWSCFAIHQKKKMKWNLSWKYYCRLPTARQSWDHLAVHWQPKMWVPSFVHQHSIIFWNSFVAYFRLPKTLKNYLHRLFYSGISNNWDFLGGGQRFTNSMLYALSLSCRFYFSWAGFKLW